MKYILPMGNRGNYSFYTLYLQALDTVLGMHEAYYNSVAY